MNIRLAFPRVTVLMPVYNGEEHLREALDSILGQTFSDFEFLIINDGSTDGSADVVNSYTDSRIRLVENDKNLGLVATLNRGLMLARGEYIARMDCDDISMPERLERQVSFMDTHPKIGICGTWIKTFGKVHSITIRFPTDPERIRCATFFNSCIGHPSIIMRKTALEMYDLCYNPAFCHAEDYALWVEALNHFDLANLGEVQLHYRLHPAQVSTRYDEAQAKAVCRIRQNLLSDLGVEFNADEFALHSLLASPTLERVRGISGDACRTMIRMTADWFGKLKDANNEKCAYPEPYFSSMLFGQWFIVWVQFLIVKGPLKIWDLSLFSVLDRLELKRSYIINHFLTMSRSLPRFISRY